MLLAACQDGELAMFNLPTATLHARLEALAAGRATYVYIHEPGYVVSPTYDPHGRLVCWYGHDGCAHSAPRAS